jgi:regulator of sigma E protease
MQQITQWLSSGWNILLVVLGLGLIIFLHELGHFLMAKKNKVRVEIFSLGFGQAIFKFRRGETEYRIAWIPLGGYVKMAGETLLDERKGEPFELTSKTPWQRFQIFVAGALMNLIIAFPIAMISYIVGKIETPNEIGRPGEAERRGGLQPGDVVLEVGGRKIDNLDKLRIEMIRHANGTIVPVKVRRDGKELDFGVEAGRSDRHDSSPPTLMMPAPLDGSALARQGVVAKDEIAEINGKKVYQQLEADSLLKASAEKDVTLKLRHRGLTFEDDDKLREVTVRIPKKTWYVIPMDDNLLEARVGDVVDDMPASGKLKKGDVIVEVGKDKINSWNELKAKVEVSGGVPLEVKVRRRDDFATYTLTPLKDAEGKGRLGVVHDQKFSSVFASVKPGSFFDRSGLKSGDRLLSVDGHPGNHTLDGGGELKLPPVVGLREDKPRTIAISVDREGKTVSLNLVAETEEAGDLAAAGFVTQKEGWFKGSLMSGPSKPFRRRAFGDAVKAGLSEPVDIFVMTLDILKKVLTLGESPKGFSGPLGIMQASYMFAELSFGNFLWLLCLITVNLGIFNLLPIPILDGGHNVLLLIEVVRKWFGKPPPGEKFIAGFQYVGLAFILTLFVFVTYNDITRLLFPRG